MTLISPISAGPLRPALAHPIAANTLQSLIKPATENTPIPHDQDLPIIAGITLDHIPFIADEAILIDDLPQTPKDADPQPSVWFLAAAAARSYLEARAVANEGPTNAERPQSEGK